MDMGGASAASALPAFPESLLNAGPQLDKVCPHALLGSHRSLQHGACLLIVALGSNHGSLHSQSCDAGTHCCNYAQHSLLIGIG